MKKVYLDYSATTPVKQEVVDAMIPYFTIGYGNPSSIHSFGREAKKDVNIAREKVARLIGANTQEVYFTAGGSESDNWALKTVMRDAKARNKGNHLITTKIEHHAILHSCEALEKEGFEVTYLDVDSIGMISLEDLESSIRPDTVMLSIMFTNNEIGTIEPIEAIGKIARKHGLIFHTDAVQAVGNTPIDVDKLNIDLLSMSAHKIYGPKGVGALYARKGIRLLPFVHGGAQEKKRRAGTENVPAIVGFGVAADLAREGLEAHIERLTNMREKLRAGIMDRIPYTKYNGHPTKRHPGNVHICFEFIEGEALLLSLDLVGIGGSSGSACTSGSLDPSHVLLSIGLTHEIAHGSLRLTIGDLTTEEDIDYVIEQLPPIINKLRLMSPLYERVLGESKNV
jgi:cysteine desulfurase